MTRKPPPRLSPSRMGPQGLMSLFSRFTVFVTGVFDWTAIVYDVTVIGAVLVFAIQILEKRRWSE